MIIIPLRAVPNQRLSFTRGENRWELELKVALSSMICSVWLNDEVVLLGSRVVAGVPLIPYPRFFEEGNFGILTAEDEEPWWEEFETTQQLVFWEND